MPAQWGPHQSLLTAGRGLLQLAAMEQSTHGPALAELSNTQCAGKCSLLHHLYCVLLGIMRLHMNHWGGDLLPCALGSCTDQAS